MSYSDLKPVKPTLKEVEEAVKTIIRWIGDDPEREGLKDTPARVVKSYAELFDGYNKSIDNMAASSFEEVGGYNDIVLLKDIPFFSHCEHHIVPIIGKAHIAYFPEKRVIGLSKIVRIVNLYAHRLQTQEKITAQIANGMEKVLHSRGVAILVEGEHMCMSMRGIRTVNVKTITTSFTGVFSNISENQSRFMKMVGYDR
ncbi:GTP cyclohydrolase I type 1 [Liberibacter crescens BT-1]|uniref:GTP cyclohydrolase 1 n=1 Tax=Liberibacter crescens (strain BT-1) TaxID=1215343 RepID=L0EW24_LIBCB|nr:GTP cyclohydrolase I FolE [Liberibacter crescens]AGA65035.1 GTP cyclohydrolase I type 1 [Liberibacter crescens BT-1]